jgi:NTP pyrophosphatase (non-canonical NTP hydrolase)
MEIIDEQGVDPSRLMTASIGLSGEVGEFNDIVKKCAFQGKEMDEDVVRHLKSELGDVMWYVAQGCMALGTDIEELIDINTAKLKDRYPGGFEEFRSENRDEDDI